MIRYENARGCSEPDAASTLFRLAVEAARFDAGAQERAEVATRVRSAIDRSSLTAAQFAALVGTSASRLSTYATGRVTPSAAMLVRIERLAGS
ncbi:MAG: helix-turn-helix domain-containing protein [Microthrixaceae bacterium]